MACTIKCALIIADKNSCVVLLPAFPLIKTNGHHYNIMFGVSTRYHIYGEKENDMSRQ